ncbi:MAG: RNA-protein complex protein Nop10 [Candidatus Bathyarchaeota archaeon]
MVWLLRKCEACKEYTLERETCPYCAGRVRTPHPAKFSPDDKYLRYRINLKRSYQKWKEPSLKKSTKSN